MDNDLNYKISVDLSQFKRAIDTLAQSLGLLDESFKEVGDDADKTARTVTSSFKDLPNRVQKTTNELKQLRQSFKDGRIDSQAFTRQATKLENELEEIRNTARQAGVETEIFGKKVDDTTGRFGKFASAGTKAFAAVGGAIAAGQAVQALANFEQQLSDIGTLLGDLAEDEIPKLRDGILEISRNSPKSAEQLGSSAYSIISAGITDTTEALRVLDEATQLAVAGLGDVQGATDLVTSALNAFEAQGLTAEQASNVLFETVKNGKTTVDELSQSFGSVAPVAAAAGISFEELNAATAALTTTGLSASEAQTQIRAATLALLKPSENLSKVFEDLGIESGKALIEQEGLVGALNVVTEAVDNDATAMAGLIGSVEGFNAALALTGPVAEAFDTTLDDLTNGVDSLNDAFEQQRQTVASQFQEFKNGLFALLVNLGEVVLPVLNGALKLVNGAIDGVFSAFDKLKGVVTFFTGESVAEGFARTTEEIDKQKKTTRELMEDLEQATARRKELEEEITEQTKTEAEKRAEIARLEAEGKITEEEAAAEQAKITEESKTTRTAAEAKARLQISATEAEAIRAIEERLQQEIAESRAEAVRLAIQQINSLQKQIVELRGSRLESANARIEELEETLARGTIGGFAINTAAVEAELKQAQRVQQDITKELDVARKALSESLVAGARDIVQEAGGDAEKALELIKEIRDPELLSAITEEFKSIGEENAAAAEAEAERAKGLKALEKEIDGAAGSEKKNTEAKKRGTSATEKLDDATKELQQSTKSAIKDIKEEYRDYESTLRDVEKAQDSINKKTEEFAESSERGFAEAENDRAILERERINELVNELVDINEQIAESEKEIREAQGDTERLEKLKEESQELKQQQEEIQKIIDQTKDLVSEEGGTGPNIEEAIAEAERLANLSEQERADEAFRAERERLELRAKIFDAQNEEELEALREQADFENEQLINERIEKLQTIELEKQEKLALEQELGQTRESIEESIKNIRIQNALEVGAVEQQQAQELLEILEQIRIAQNNIQGGGGSLPIIPQAHEGGMYGERGVVGTTGSTVLRKPGRNEMLAMVRPREFSLPENPLIMSEQNQRIAMNRMQPLYQKHYGGVTKNSNTNNSINGVEIHLHEQAPETMEKIVRSVRRHV